LLCSRLVPRPLRERSNYSSWSPAITTRPCPLHNGRFNIALLLGTIVLFLISYPVGIFNPFQKYPERVEKGDLGLGTVPFMCIAVHVRQLLRRPPYRLCTVFSSWRALTIHIRPVCTVNASIRHAGLPLSHSSYFGSQMDSSGREWRSLCVYYTSS